MTKANVTLKDTVDIAKGRNVKKAWLSKNLVDAFSGSLKRFSDNDIRRLMTKMLIMGALEEVFISTSFGSGNNISVYIALCKKHSQVLTGKTKIYLANGIDDN